MFKISHLQTFLSSLSIRPLIHLSYVQGFLILLFFFYSTVVFSQKIQSHVYGPQNGDYISNIRSIHQSESGILWVGTGIGLSNWNGSDWNHLGLKEGLSFGSQWDVISDNNTVYSLAGNQLMQISVHSSDQVSFLNIGLLNSTIVIKDAQLVINEGRPIAVVLSDQGELFIWDNVWKKIELDHTVQSYSSSNSRLAILDSQGEIFTVNLQDYSLTKLFVQQKPSNFTDAHLIISDKNTWVVDSRTSIIYQYTSTQFNRLAFLDNFNNDKMPSYALDKKAGLFLSDGRNIWHFNQDGIDFHINNNNHILDSPISSMFLDRESQLWVGHQTGLIKYTNLNIKYFSSTDNLLGNDITSLLELPDGRIIVGHSHGLSIIDGDIITQHPYNDQFDRKTMDLAYWHEKVWVSSYTRGLMYFDLKTQQFYKKEIPQGHLITTALTISKDNTLIVTSGTAIFELFSIDGTLKTLATGLPQIRQVKTDPVFGTIVMTQAGLNIRPHKGSPYWIYSDEEKANNTFNYYRSKSGKMWVATLAGPRIIEDKVITKPAGITSEINLPTFFISQTPDEAIWFGTNSGVYKYHENNISHFDKSNGFVGKETFRESVFVSSTHKLWVGSDFGLHIFSGFTLKKNPAPPIVTLVEAAANGEIINLHKNNKLELSNNFLAIRYRAISLLDHSKLRVQYKLEGYEDQWENLIYDSHNWVRYAALPPGTFIFNLRASNSRGEWSNIIKSSPIIISKPIWNRPWFYLLGILLLILIIILLQRFSLMRSYSLRLSKDVSARTIQLESSQRSYEHLYQRVVAVLSSISEGVIVTDLSKRILTVNPAAENILLLHTEQMIGRNLEDIIIPKSISRAFQHLIEHPEKGGICMIDLKTTGNTERRVVLDASRFDNDETGMVWVIRDITQEEKVAAELRKAEKLEAVGMLAGGLAHDFNNLLSVMLGNVSLLGVSEELSNANRKFVNETEKAILRARDLTHRLLTFSKGGSPVKRLASLDELLRESASFILSGSNCTVDFDIQDNLYHVNIDSSQINQVINNLLINATQSMPNGGRINIKAINIESAPDPLPDNPYVNIIICDQGSGIPVDIKDRIFDPFFTTKSSGNGLGLASSYTIVANHDGMLTLDDVYTGGACFHIYLPAADEKQETTKIQSRQINTGNGLVLIMDDQKSVIRILSAQLKNLGYDVISALDGESAIDMFSNQQLKGCAPDLLIFDLTVPGAMGGIEALQVLRSRYNNFKAIVSSGYSQDPAMANPKKFGFDEVLPKPYNLTQLSHVIESLTITE